MARFAAGFGLRLVIETPDGAAPTTQVSLTARDAKGAWRLTRTTIRTGDPLTVVWPKPPHAEAG